MAPVAVLQTPGGCRGGEAFERALDKTARLWEADSGKLLAAFQGHTDRVMSAVFSADGETLALGSCLNIQYLRCDPKASGIRNRVEPARESRAIDRSPAKRHGQRGKILGAGSPRIVSHHFPAKQPVMTPCGI